MKVKALANLSGRVGTRNKGEEFTVDASHARELIERRLVVEVSEPVAPEPEEAKPAKRKAKEG